MGWNRPKLMVAEILRWADAHHARTGSWPQVDVSDDASLPLGERWRNIDRALRDGYRGLEGGSSLARLLDTERGVRNPKDLPLLTEDTILAWARSHRRRVGEWPGRNAGPIVGTDGESWQNIDAALKQGTRGLPGRDSLAQLLARRLGARTRASVLDLSVRLILRWADAHHARTGAWPGMRSGPVASAPEETWGAVDSALRRGLRGLPGGDTLFRLLVRHGRRGSRRQRGLADSGPATGARTAVR